jgi:hypothetical protein
MDASIVEEILQMPRKPCENPAHRGPVSYRNATKPRAEGGELRSFDQICAQLEKIVGC